MKTEDVNNPDLIFALQRIRFLQQSLASLDELYLDEEGVEGLRLVVDDICSSLKSAIEIDNS